jgi:hypothetical protein
MTRKRSVVGAVTVIALSAVAAAGAISAPAAEKPRKSAANQLLGTWDVTVNRQAPLTPLRSLQTYMSGGGVVEIANGGTALRSPSHGAWEHTAERLYSSTILFFRYEPQTGAYLGTQQVNSTLRLSQDGETFRAVALSVLRDPGGNVVLSGLRATVAGTRIHVERIPDQP